MFEAEDEERLKRVLREVLSEVLDRKEEPMPTLLERRFHMKHRA